MHFAPDTVATCLDESLPDHTVPNAVVNRVFDAGVSPRAAWREQLRLTQSEVATRMGITQTAYA